MEDMFRKIHELQDIAGKGSDSKKAQKIAQLLSLCTSEQEVEYLVRFLEKKMRVGLNRAGVEKVVESTEEILGYSRAVEFGVPLRPMLARSHGEMERGWCEHKHDGERMQVHFFEGRVELFGRSLERKTEAFAGVCERLRLVLRRECILDCELVWKAPVSFQDYQQFKKDNAGLRLVCFDIMRLGEEVLVDHVLSDRRSRIEGLWEHNDVIELVRSFEFSSQAELHARYLDALSSGMEGLVLKQDVPYKQGARNFWIKRKQTHDVDLVVVGAYWGKGKRKDVLAAFLLGAIDHDGAIHPVTKVGTGLDEKEL